MIENKERKEWQKDTQKGCFKNQHSRVLVTMGERNKRDTDINRQADTHTLR